MTAFENAGIITLRWKTPRLPPLWAAFGSVLFFLAMSAKFAGVT